MTATGPSSPSSSTGLGAVVEQSTGRRYSAAGMNVFVTGVGPSTHDEAVRVIRETLAARALGDTLHIHATRFANGEWLVFVTDMHEVEVIDGEIAERLQAALKEVR